MFSFDDLGFVMSNLSNLSQNESVRYSGASWSPPPPLNKKNKTGNEIAFNEHLGFLVAYIIGEGSGAPRLCAHRKGHGNSWQLFVIDT